MFIVDILVYSIFIWYIEVVFPGKYGVSKPWYFPVVPLIQYIKSETSSVSEDREGKHCNFFF